MGEREQRDREQREREQRERERTEIPPPPPPPAGEPERAARKMDVDEDYGDEADEDKKGGIASATASGPGSASGEAKTASPTGPNGHQWRYKRPTKGGSLGL